MRTRTFLVGVAASTFILSLGLAGPAQATKDSGVHSYGCGSNYGKLSIYQRGSGNSWAPGDWGPGYSQWNGNSSSYRWVYDLQDGGYGGGTWRVAANDTYSTVTPGCSAFG